MLDVASRDNPKTQSADEIKRSFADAGRSSSNIAAEIRSAYENDKNVQESGGITMPSVRRARSPASRI